MNVNISKQGIFLIIKSTNICLSCDLLTEKGFGSWVGGHVDAFKFNASIDLDKTTEVELYELYLKICRIENCTPQITINKQNNKNDSSDIRGQT